MLSQRQAEVLGTIREMIACYGHPPTTRELAAEMNVAVSVVHRSLVRLRAAGMVDWDPQRARTLRVVEDVNERGVG